MHWTGTDNNERAVRHWCTARLSLQRVLIEHFLCSMFFTYAQPLHFFPLTPDHFAHTMGRSEPDSSLTLLPYRREVTTVSRHPSVVRTVIRRLLVGCAVLWIVIEAWLVLEASFGMPYGLQKLIAVLARKPGFEGLIGRLVAEGWPTIFFTFLVLIRQELKRWAKKFLKTHANHQTANLIIVSWFVFLGTLMAVHHFSGVKIVLPPSARETSVVLAILLAGSWCSRFMHWMRRQYMRFQRVRRIFRASTKQAFHLSILSIKRRVRRKGQGHVTGDNQYSPRRRAA